MQQSGSVVVGEIEPDKLYTLDAFKRASGLKDWALRTARKAGLKMHLVGNRKFVKGKDFIDYLESLDTATKQQNNPQS